MDLSSPADLAGSSPTILREWGKGDLDGQPQGRASGGTGLVHEHRLRPARWSLSDFGNSAGTLYFKSPPIKAAPK